MSRELNRELFGEPSGATARPQTRPSSPGAGAPPATTGATAEDLKLANIQIEAIVRKLKEYESKMELLNSKLDEFTGVSKLRFERIQGHFQRQAEGIQASFRDIHSKVATVAGRINERKMSDGAITDLIQRHQQVVQTFEVRLQQLQKVMSEQELQLMNSRSELKEALKELDRLKRG